MEFRWFLYSSLILCVVSACEGKKASDEQKYPRWVGDITFDPLIDDKSFTICHGDSNVVQYFNNGKGLEYKGERSSLHKEFKRNYSPIRNSISSTGWIRIRFIVNCNGKTDRFRVLSSDDNYQNKEMTKDITDQLLKITKELNGWEILVLNGEPRDYYQYLIFKIVDGEIDQIMP